LYKRDHDHLSEMDTLHYSELRPGPPLAAAIRCIWMMQGSAVAGSAPDPVVPDGCVELVLNLADPFERLTGGGFTRQPLAMLVGQNTGPVIIRPTGRVDLIGIRLHPWAAGRLLRVPAKELRDQLVPLQDAPMAVGREVLHLRDAVASIGRSQRRLSVVTCILERALARAPLYGASDRRAPVSLVHVARLVQLALASGVPSTVRAMAARTGYSVRTIQRIFDHDVGLAPKTLIRIARMQRALRIARLSPTLSWTAIGARAGYFDQSHLIRDFRELVGCVPSEFRAPEDSLTQALLERREGESRM
jgi:AraC-like DNA-binding protein